MAVVDKKSNSKNIESIYPLSPMQQGMLFHTLYAPETGVYFQQLVCSLNGQLNISAFEQAWQRVIERHPVLRTLFLWENRNKPLQVVRQIVNLPWTNYDWRSLSSIEQQEELENFLQADRDKGFELNQAPLMRCTLIRVADYTYNFVWSHHHLLLDGWSIPTIIKEIFAFYDAFNEGNNLNLDKPRPYEDYIDWCQKQDISQAKRFWQLQLKGLTATTPLIVDKPLIKNQEQPSSYATQHAQLTEPATIALQAFTRQHQLTLNNLVQGAWAILLSRYSGEVDVIFGATVSGRPPDIVGIESMVGLFINTLPIRVSVPAEIEVLPWLKELQAQQVEREQHSYNQLVEIQSWTEIPKGMPLFESIVVFENYPIDASEQNNGINISNVRSIERTNYPLNLAVIPGRQLSVGISYDSDRFDAATISRMLGHFQILLESLAANPHQHLNELPLLTKTEENQLLSEWNNTQTTYFQEQCIHELFELQVECSPDAIAIVYEDEQLTYQELNNRANQLAHHLRNLGVGAEILVGICVERSIEMLIGILGILKAGGAYVPLDPNYPQERLSFSLEDSQVKVLITQQQLLSKLPAHQAQVLCIDADWEIIAQQSVQNPQIVTTSANLAYIIYTSGSTGKPKGVLINHANVVRLFTATEEWFYFNQQDVWTLFHSFAFDFSVWEIWGALIKGGRLVVVPYWVSRSPADFLKLLDKQKVTVLNQTPSAFRQLIQAEQLIDTPANLALRWVIFGGEALEIQSLKPWFERHGDKYPQLVNMYGITETTVHVTYRPITIADLSSNTGSVIGCPIPDLQVYVLDKAKQLLPIGVPGEMYVGGASLARGYLNRVELTSQVFVANPFSDDPNARLYKTGDLARYLENGDLEYLGRIDNQVKIRGFRIELGEIEAALTQHPQVQASVVIARVDTPGDTCTERSQSKRLVAYLVIHQAQVLTVNDLRQFLDSKLPEYMIPAAFVFLDSLPLTSNGKVDRRALPVPDTARTEEKAFVAPRTPTEKLLTDIWAQVLGLEQVGINDNFFALGGDSIRSIQVQSQSQKQGLSFSLQQLFVHQTISNLVQELQSVEVSRVIIESEKPFSLISETDRQKLPDEVEDAYPLTMLQMGMLFHSELNEDTAVYHNVSSFHLQAHFNLEKFQTAVEQLVARHPILRTSIDLSNFSEPLQLVHRQVPIPLQMKDLSHLSVDEQQQKIDAWFEAEKNRKFDWKQSPLLRFQIHCYSPEEFQFSFTEHHAILDGWSVASMLNELFGNYFSLVNQKAQPLLPSPSSSFRNFVALERQALGSKEHEYYWTEKLKECTITMVPRWYSSQQKAKVRQVGTQDVPLSADLYNGLQKLAQFIGVPLKSVLLAAHVRVLSIISNQVDVLTGLVANGRPEQTDSEQVLGLFLNSLPFRLNLSGGTWVDLIRQVFDAEVELLPFRRYPLGQLQRILGGQPLFEIIFNFVHFHVYQTVIELNNNVELLGLKSVEETNFTLAVNFKLNPGSSELEVGFAYDASELCREQIKAISSYYVKTLDAMVKEPLESYELCSGLSTQEQYQLLEEWNDTQRNYLQDICIHQFFEMQVERTPDAVALVFENQQLTYRELNQQANHLAHYLRTLGVRVDVLVGLCVERSLEMLVGLLGILKAGGAYVPIDPEYPQERISHILSDSQVSLLLTQHRLVARLPEHQATLVVIDESWEQIIQHSQENPISGVKDSDLVNVIYTSGSTGKPKGVMVKHSGLCNLAQAQIDLFDLLPSSRILQFASFSFDASIWEVVMALGSGARLYLGTKESLLPGLELIELLRDYGITHITLPPSALAVLPQAELPALQNIIVAGEACAPDLIKQWSVGRRFFNAYGPTETTVCATVAECGNGERSDKPPIGRPIPNTQAYILDSYLQPVPIGVPGELHIGGAGVAQGYLNRPDLTQEKFIPNPFNNSKFKIQNSKLYKTGDLARYLPDGNIEYLGRIDHQVKIRGFRIELGEIEAILSQHPAILQVTVIAREDTPGDKCLVAYLALNQEPTPTINELRQFLGSKLPEYMIPSAFVFLETLPLTPNGKVDRRALPLPETLRELEVNFVAPRTPIEEILAPIWADVLRVEQIGVYDNFFELGGHSLLATQLVSRIRTTFKIELPLRSLFEAATIANLAEYIQQYQRNSSELLIPPLQPVARNENIPLSFAQQRLWFLNQLDPNSAAYNIPGAVSFQGQLNVAALEQSLSEIIRRHEALRTNFITQAGEAVQIIRPVSSWTMTVIDLQDLPADEREIEIQQLATVAAQQPFDLVNESLIRTTLLAISETENILLFCMHHIVSDGWSMGVFVQEVAELYTAFSQGHLSSLPELAIQYADFAVWQRQWLQGEVKESQINYWREQLAGAPALLELPTDRPRPAVQTFRGTTQSFSLSEELSQALSLLSRQEGVTLFMTLLAAFDTLLHRYTGQTDILVGSAIANRNYSEIEGLIGFFVNTLVFRTDVSGNPSFRQLLERVREVSLEAHTHQDLPFELLVEALQPERDLSHTPLFQVMFVFQNTPTSDIELPGLTLSSLTTESLTAKFDLTLAFENTDQGLVGAWEYNTDLFDTLTIARMIGHFQTLLESIVTNPEQPVSQLPLLTVNEQHQLLNEWNNTQTEYPQNQCIHELFTAQAERNPDLVAAVFGSQQITYQELNSRANQLAHYLRTLGVGTEVLVGIFVERSLEMLVGLLGILKAGGAYVPLDPDYPQERLSLMLADSQVPVLLTQQRLVEKLPEYGQPVVCLDTGWDIINRESTANLHSEVTADKLAYVIYTSGSTGKPKGVAVPHRAVNRLVFNTNYIQLDANDCIAQAANASFDAATFEIWGALLHGARLVGVTHNIALSPQEFAAYIREQEISVLFLTTALFNQLASFVPQAFNTLRYLLFGGEAVDPRWVKEVLQNGAPQHLLHVYGPTESTTFSSWFLIEDVPATATTIPIGQPISNTQIYLLDQNLQPVPIGVPGELYIGGDGLAQGYLNRLELTQEKFIANPFNNSKLYKTGDLGRYLPDGNIEYLARIDNQVKIRGFRIELGEIETALLQHPAIREVVVLAREDISDDACGGLCQRRLVAYIIFELNQTHSISDLRSFLQRQLPNYMIPAAFVFLEQFPLTPNGKIDRRSLPAPDLSAQFAASYVAPRSKIEQAIANIWQEVLQLEKVGIDDNFFDLGGHSLLMVKLTQKLQEFLNQDISLLEMFKYPTISTLAKYLSSEKTDSASDIEKKNNQITDIKAGRNRLKQRLARSSKGANNE
ncbi:non-ribosomal peptide synthetase [Nostoc punctiforme]|uniref:Amino acid adenylation domain protein n=1 Tax=Nostoc punctiforme (strain ATCC 29133 / PCC 73102) TaxID=63737 RepID=B2IXJ9_NOSP7|nr:non-ribosomal peptide synthetase [Nostoc punctiforme]ACC81527.1 amino acid adenylation domain protein [Nostoc punctiforme PCC 73102]